MAGAGAVVILRRATIGDDGVEESDPVVVIVVVWLLLAAGETKKFGNFICKLVKSDGDAGATGVVSDIEWSPKRVNTGTLANCSVGIRILVQHLVQMVLRHNLQLCHHEPKTENRVLRHTKHTFPLMTSSLMDDSRGRFSSEAEVRTCLMCITS